MSVCCVCVRGVGWRGPAMSGADWLVAEQHVRTLRALVGLWLGAGDHRGGMSASSSSAVL